jgi:hypothetical protein
MEGIMTEYGQSNAVGQCFTNLFEMQLSTLDFVSSHFILHTYFDCSEYVIDSHTAPIGYYNEPCVSIN